MGHTHDRVHTVRDVVNRLVLLAYVTSGLVACRPAVGAPPKAAEDALQRKTVLTPAAPLPDDQARRMMDDLSDSGNDPEKALAARWTVVRAGDERFIPIFIELMRAGQIGIVGRADYGATILALEELSGEEFGPDWTAWVEWYAASDLVPPPGFTDWKGRLLGRIDPRFAEFLQDDLPSRIRVEEIQWGGVVFDSVPALDSPAMVAAGEVDFLEAWEPVFGLAIGGEARAYPLRILDWHEMTNDVIGGVPVTLAYCALCGAGIAFAGRATDGSTYTFGTSGFLLRSSTLMFDRQTHTLWNPMTGEPVLGALAATDVRLNLLPLVLTTWQDWQVQHPDTLVLDIDTGYDRNYEPGQPYGHYFASPDTILPVWPRSSLLSAKAQVYTLQLDGVPKAYPVEMLTTAQVVNDVVGGIPVVLVATRGTVAVSASLGGLPVNYQAGAEVRAYHRGEETFAPGPDPSTVLDSQGREWQVTEEALVGPGGERTRRIAGHLAYWFEWFAFFPHTLLYEE